MTTTQLPATRAQIDFLRVLMYERLEMDVADSTTDEALDEMCRKLLANMVIENYRIEKLEPEVGAA
jgi:phosphoribosylformylglycinamidine synthase